MAVTFSAEEGVIEFPNGSRLEMLAESDTPDVVLSVPEAGEVERMQGAVASHLDRFAFREAPLRFDWREG